jgi:hypothetical protein
MENKVFPFITIVTGAPEHGKSYRTLEELKQFTRDDTKYNRKGRPVLILDTNNEYSDIPSIKYDVENPNDSERGKYFRLFTKPQLMRVKPLTMSGEKMNFDQLQTAMLDILNNFRRGGVLLDDINTFIKDFNSLKVISTLVNSRHRGIDLILHFQSLSKIATTMWENAKIVRSHYQVDNVDRYSDRIPNYELIKIATMIVNKVYFSKAENAKYFFVYIDNRGQKIICGSRQLFVAACSDYVKKYQRTEINQEMVAYRISQEDAIKKLILEKIKKYYPDGKK